MPPSWAVLGVYAIDARVSLLGQHSAEREMSACACTRCMPGLSFCCYLRRRFLMYSLLMKWKTLLRSWTTRLWCKRARRRQCIASRRKQYSATARETIFTLFWAFRRWVLLRRVCTDDVSSKIALFVLNSFFYRATHAQRMCLARHMLWPWVRPSGYLFVTRTYCIETAEQTCIKLVVDTETTVGLS